MNDKLALKAWAVLLLVFGGLEVVLGLCELKILPGRDPGPIQHLSVVAGALFSGFQVGYRCWKLRKNGGGEDR